jgi:hypothetical protein
VGAGLNGLKAALAEGRIRRFAMATRSTRPTGARPGRR